MKKLSSIFIVFTILLSLGTLTHCQSYESLADKETLRKNLTILASDEFMGREAASEGERMASEFIVKKLIEYGIKPFDENGDYLQPFDVYISGYKYQSAFSITDQTNTRHNLKFAEDYIIYSPVYVPHDFSINNTDMIFAGYGIEADEYKYNDYDDIDVSGKVVIVMAGEPESKDEKYFDGDYRTEYSDIKSKLITAKKYGALAMILLPDNDELESYKYKRHRVVKMDFSLTKQEEDTTEDIVLPNYLLSFSGVQKILLNKVSSIIQVTDVKIIERIFGNKEFPLKLSAEYRIDKVNEKKSANNIIGMLPGTDPDVKEECVAIGAHYDHEGIKYGHIFNGADDNASGTVTVLETARLLSSAKQNERPVVFIFHTGEERGLLGSKHLVATSDFVNDIISYINVDMVGREEENSIYSIGSDRVSLEYHQLIEKVNHETVNLDFDYTFDSPGDPNRFYYRSDHYNYALRGIPVVFFYDHMTIDYHRPADDADKINYNKVAKVTDLVYNIILTVANLDHSLKN